MTFVAAIILYGSPVPPRRRASRRERQLGKLSGTTPASLRPPALPLLFLLSSTLRRRSPLTTRFLSSVVLGLGENAAT
ncbi:hypothetical protein LX32DRAFT_640196 [Colletotrichum zoysiae]|uniref:Uncharacterized protein n=1 Tax=Colletotrichum zoysiae TaxID=1216348 RepID=A0AAD9M162_9PEZI|nr:hypothetical protein LX32DRAFT_640196 [Colletotrichum zoysiae]